MKVTAYSFGTTAVEVEVDTDTGEVKVTDIWAVNDCGTVLNPARHRQHARPVEFHAGSGPLRDKRMGWEDRAKTDERLPHI
jgi:xanthine dehydrogenase molybdopterin-binding subunit B